MSEHIHTHTSTHKLYTHANQHVSVHRHKLHTLAVLTYKRAHTHSLAHTHALANTYTHSHLQRYTCLHRHTMLLTHVYVLCCHCHLWKTKSCAPLPPPTLPSYHTCQVHLQMSPSPALLQQHHLCQHRSVRCAGLCQRCSQTMNHVTQRFLMFVLKFKKQPPCFSVSHTHTKQFTHCDSAKLQMTE